MKGYWRILAILVIIGHLVQTYYIIQVCRAELAIVEQDNERELVDWFTEDKK